MYSSPKKVEKLAFSGFNPLHVSVCAHTAVRKSNDTVEVSWFYV